MAWQSELMFEQKFEALKSERDASKRGYELEMFLAELFGREHFRVTKGLVVEGRQIDLFANRGPLNLLVEAKWTRRSATAGALDGLHARLRTASPDVVGLLVSMSGFSRGVVARVEGTTERPVLLVSGDEIADVVRRGGGLHSLLTWKYDELMRHRKARVNETHDSPAPWLQNLPEAGLKIVAHDGSLRSWWEDRGDFAGTVCTLSPPDVSWACRGGVRLGMVIGILGASDLVDLLKRMAQLGWLSSEGAWRIEQQGLAWSGLGPAEFARQLADWMPRYNDRRLHHSEQAIYTDQFDGGMLTLQVDLSADELRAVRWCELTFLLEGVPLDPSPLEALRSEIPVVRTPVFQVQSEDPLTGTRIAPRRGRSPVQPVAYLVRDPPLPGSFGDPSKRWVEGIIVRDPIPRLSVGRRAIGLTTTSLGSVIVPLSQHHQFGDDVQYHVTRATTVRTSEVQVLHVRGDWSWAPREER